MIPVTNSIRLNTLTGMEKNCTMRKSPLFFGNLTKTLAIGTTTTTIIPTTTTITILTTTTVLREGDIWYKPIY